MAECFPVLETSARGEFLKSFLSFQPELLFVPHQNSLISELIPEPKHKIPKDRVLVFEENRTIQKPEVFWQKFNHFSEPFRNSAHQTPTQNTQHTQKRFYRTPVSSQNNFGFFRILRTVLKK
jgi:hypothetical protein